MRCIKYNLRTKFKENILLNQINVFLQTSLVLQRLKIFFDLSLYGNKKNQNAFSNTGVLLLYLKH